MITSQLIKFDYYGILRYYCKQKVIKMKKSILLLIVLVFISVTCLSLFACNKQTDYSTVDGFIGTLKMTWNDEFDENTLKNYWQWKDSDTTNENQIYYSKDSCFIESGNLIERINYQENGKCGSGWYHGSIETMYNFKQTYGYFECRAIVPLFHGGWGAFWLMPYNQFRGDYLSSKPLDDPEYVAPEKNPNLNTATDGAEIDIFEAWWGYDKNGHNANSTIHYDYGKYLKSTSKQTTTESDIYDGQFHTFGLLWTKNAYRMYIDGKLTVEFDDKGYVDKNKKFVSHNIISQVPEYLILSTELRGGWAGDLELNDKSKNYDFVVDYLRAYQLPEYM